MQLAIPLVRGRQGETIAWQIYSRLRQMILCGALRPGDQLPSTRNLAEQLGVSRMTVVQAYEQLLEAEFVSGRAGSGTYVSEDLKENMPRRARAPGRLRLSRFGKEISRAAPAVDSPRAPDGAIRYDFRYGRSDLETFPFETWRRLLQRQARKGSARQFHYGSALGNLDLRAAIGAHLGRSRAVVCEPSEIVMVNGSQQALDLVIRVLVEPGDRVAIEEPHYDGTREALRAAGARLVPIAVDRDGIDPAKLRDDLRLIFVTPSHQFPTGAILGLNRRLALLEWARKRHAIVVEDDYDGEFQYEGRPIESLQGLDGGKRTVYIGTFSRTVFPALRIGYLVAPPSTIPAFRAAKWITDLHSATLEQQTLAEFITSGYYERHLRRLRRRNTERRAAMLDSIGRYLGERVEITGEDSGAHIVLWPRKQMPEATVVERAQQRGVAIYGISHCFLNDAPRPGFMLGFAHLNEIEIREGIKLLSAVL